MQKLTDITLFEAIREVNKANFDVTSKKVKDLYYPVVWQGDYKNKIGEKGYPSHMECIQETYIKIYNQIK